MRRVDEMNHRSGIEIALFERKRDANHLESFFYVGMIVHEPSAVISDGMEYIQ